MKGMYRALAVLLTCSFILSGCFFLPDGDEPADNSHMIGPRSEEAWKRWEEEQKALKETWGETEVYAYIMTIMEDLENVNANVVFKEDFSLEEESEELDAFRKMYDDMNVSEEYTLEEFRRMLDDSLWRYAIGGIHELDSIEERNGEDGGGYHARILYYANHESLMPVDLIITTDDEGKFSVTESFAEEQNEK